MLQRVHFSEAGVATAEGAPIRITSRVPPLVQGDLPLNAVTVAQAVRYVLQACVALCAVCKSGGCCAVQGGKSFAVTGGDAATISVVAV